MHEPFIVTKCPRSEDSLLYCGSAPVFCLYASWWLYCLRPGVFYSWWASQMDSRCGVWVCYVIKVVLPILSVASSEERCKRMW